MRHGMQRIAQSSDERAIDQRKVFIRLVTELKPYRRAVAGSFAMILVSAASQAAGPYLIGQAIDVHIIGGNPAGLAQTMLILLAAYFLYMLAMRFQIYLMSWAGQKVLNDLRLKIMEQVGRLALQDMEDDEAGDLMSRLVNWSRRLGESTLSPDMLEEAAQVVELTDPDSDLITLVDVTPVNRTRNFHNFSLETPEFFDDLFLRLVNHDAPRSRQQHELRTPDGKVYWVLTRGR